MTREDFREHCDDALDLIFDYSPSVTVVADRILDRVIAVLRRDPRFAKLKRSELELLLADARRDSEQDLNDLVDVKVDCDELLDAIERAIFEPVEAAT